LHTITGILHVRHSLTNYSYSTCLGRVVPWKSQNKLGFIDLNLPERLLELLEDDINGASPDLNCLRLIVAPNGLLYVKPTVRRALLAKMLSEILDTRVMIKNSMNVYDNDKSFAKLQNNRQLVLKFIANVTYGYASASFSGRMPCAEIADSIVQSGRETLEKVPSIRHHELISRQLKLFIQNRNGVRRLYMGIQTACLCIFQEGQGMKLSILETTWQKLSQI
jgi:DNA polymerase family B